MKRYAVKLYYDGKNFQGFQLQKNGRTVAGEILSALLKSRLVDDFRTAHFQAASRTDKGVSALGQTIAFNTDKNFSLKRLNAFLPVDIYAWAWTETSLGFNPRKEAVKRTYVYINPYHGENLQFMKKTAETVRKKLVFGSYVNKKGELKPRTLKKLTITKKEDFVFFVFSAKSFVRNLVRRLVSLILKVGLGEIPIDRVENLLEKGLVFNLPLAPAENLILLDVQYKFGFNVDEASKKILMDKLRKEICKSELKRLCLKNLEQL